MQPRFIQIHTLTSYPTSNLNRDDMGRPKTIFYGNAERLRISSQCAKRAWRTSDKFEELANATDSKGYRTKKMPLYIFNALTQGVTLHDALRGQDGDLTTLPEKEAMMYARLIGDVFGKMKPEQKKSKKKSDDEEQFNLVDIETGEVTETPAEDEGINAEALDHESLVFYGSNEINNIAMLVEEIREGRKPKSAKEFDLLSTNQGSIDVALFGRMLAKSPEFNVDGAVHVAHAFSVTKAAIVEDFFTALDDCNTKTSAHLGYTQLSSGLFYQYVTIDCDILAANLNGKTDLVKKALNALVRVICTVSPHGKQNSCASHSVASYCLVEKGNQQPISLAEAFITPVQGGDVVALAKDALIKKRDMFARITGEMPESCQYDAEQGSLDEICAFVSK